MADNDTHRLMQLHKTVKKYHDNKNSNVNGEAGEVGKEIELAYTRAVNQLVNTDDGKIFLQIMLAYCGVFNYNESVNQAQDLIDKGKKGVWLKMIRPYLKKENIMKVEI